MPTKKVRNASITTVKPILVSGPVGEMLRPLRGAMNSSGRSRS
jgi:hypothetical protein